MMASEYSNPTTHLQKKQLLARSKAAAQNPWALRVALCCWGGAFGVGVGYLQGGVLFWNRTGVLCNYLIWSSTRKITWSDLHALKKELILSCQLQVFNTFTSLCDKILLTTACQAKHPRLPSFVINYLKLTSNPLCFLIFVVGPLLMNSCSWSPACTHPDNMVLICPWH